MAGRLWRWTKLLSWNHKFLDYEIETWTHFPKCIREEYGWNHKFLDYEIETRTDIASRVLILSWNHKFLDYEIETSYHFHQHYEAMELESQVSRLRD